MSQNNPFEAYYCVSYNIAAGANQTFTPGVVEPWKVSVSLDTDTTVNVQINGGNNIALSQYQTIPLEQKASCLCDNSKLTYLSSNSLSTAEAR